MKFNYLFLKLGGACPVLDFFEERTEKEKGKIMYYLKMLEKAGPFLREPYVKKITENLYELRPGFANIEMRLLYFWDGPMAWIVNGFIKKTQKTPPREIELANERMKRYFNAKGAKK